MEKIDRETARAMLEPWLAERMPGARNLRVARFHDAKEGNSAETVLFDVAYDRGGRETTEGLVLRRQYEGTDLFLNSDLRWQVRVMEAMGRQLEPPVPHVVGLEMDRAILGAPFYVMNRIEGRVVQQFPNYNLDGWLAELPVNRRGEVWLNAMAALAKVHKVDLSAGFQFMDDPRGGRPGLDQYLHHVEEWFDWAAKGREQPTADAAMAWLKANKPRDAAVGLMWGDAQAANMLFAEDNSVAAVLDWEMAAIGPGEADLAWWIFFDDMFSEGYGVPRLKGLPDRSEMIGAYEAVAGRKVSDLDYYLVLAMVRLGIISLRQYDRQVGFGRLSPGNTAYLNNPIQAMIARKLGLPVPEVGADFQAMLAARKD